MKKGGKFSVFQFSSDLRIFSFSFQSFQISEAVHFSNLMEKKSFQFFS